MSKRKAVKVLNSTNYTPIKKTLPCSLLLQELEAQEEGRLEELLQGVETLEESLQDLPSIEDHTEVERQIEQIERELGEYLNGP
jgi:uncharacterized protein YlxW (UPF0749 family)